MADIFLSYAREDHARAEQIAKALIAAGYEVFWDVEIPPGKSWADVLEEKLAVSKAAIVLWSKISAASKWVREEARVAHDRGKLIPVQIDGTSPPFGFGEIQAADLKGWRGDTSDPQWRALLSAVSTAVARPPATPLPNAQTVTHARATPPSVAADPTAPAPSSSWFNPSMRGYLLAGVGIVALLGALALRFMPEQPSTPPSTTVTDGSSSSTTSARQEPGEATSPTDTPSTATVPSESADTSSDAGETLSKGVTRAEIRDYLAAHGYEAKITTDANNNSIVKTTVDGVTFNVYFYDCQGERCPQIQFSAGWRMPSPPTPELVNDWNRSKRLARAYTSEKGDELFIEVDLDLENTTSNAQINEYLRVWKILLGNFKKHFSL